MIENQVVPPYWHLIARLMRLWHGQCQQYSLSRWQPSLLGLACLLASGSLASGQSVIALRGGTLETVTDEGRIENGTLLIRDGKIEDVGEEVEIPISAKVIELTGKTILPGFIDPYFVVDIGRNVRATPTRTVVFRGRVFVIGGGSPAIATTFARVADDFRPTDIDWDTAVRSGIAVYHMVTSGYAQSSLAQAETAEAGSLLDPEGELLVTLTNDTDSLNVLREGLESDDAEDDAGGGKSGKASRARRRERGGRQTPSPSNETGLLAESAKSSAASKTSESADSRGAKQAEQDLWKAVRKGESPVFVNVNNAAAILHAERILDENEINKAVLIASGSEVFLTLPEVDWKRYTVILPPQLDEIPNSRDRINVPRMLMEQDINFVLSLSLAQSDYRAHQTSPLFGVSMLVRTGLPRDAALRALTLGPAKLLGIADDVGSLEVGKKANLVVLDGDPFDVTTEVQQIFIEGKMIDVNP